MPRPSRRNILRSGIALGSISTLGPPAAAPAAPGTPLRSAPEPTDDTPDDAVQDVVEEVSPVDLTWLEGGVPGRLAAGTTWGVPWPRGALPGEQEFSLASSSGTAVPIQSWTAATWPDGSLKWSAHAVSDAPERSESYELAPGSATAPETAVVVQTDDSTITVSTGVAEATFPLSGEHIISSVSHRGTVVATDGRLVGSTQSKPDADLPENVRRSGFASAVSEVTVEQEGPVRAVVRVQGTHKGRGRGWLPFDLRFSMYAGSEAIHLVHTFVFDGDPSSEVIASLGVEFSVPLAGELHDRHIRFTGPEGGVLSEAVRGVTGLRRDPGSEVREAQVAGRATPDPSTWDQRVTSRLHWIPAFGDYSLSQLTAHGFELRKRTSPGHSWIRVDAGSRAPGTAYVGTPTGGFALGLRNFWQLHPTELSITGAATDAATATIWLWSPRAESMDLRFYHDGLGQDTYEKQRDALEITYEDYEPGFADPRGIARTSEMTFWALGGTPAAADLAAMSAANETPPLLVCSPEHSHTAGVFGSWTPVDRSDPAKAEIEDRLDAMFEYYRDQVDQRSWYGFWDYGDVMHSYDGDRHQWRYDIGGYAWDNSELSTDLWLWYHYLRTGSADAFRLAEAMSRHTGEVDTYHLGDFAGLGTRHGVQHWGDSAKQVRISNANYRRHHFFLTADERTGDLLRTLVHSDQAFLALDPGRKGSPPTQWDPDPAAIPKGPTTDWSALAGAWLTEWERGGDPIARTKLLNGARSIAALPNGWVQSGTTYDLEDGTYSTTNDGSTVHIGSLAAVFGLIEVMTELLDLVDEPEVRAKWVEFCRLYNAAPEEQEEATGSSWGTLNLKQAYSRATAYASVHLEDPDLADRAWTEFRTGHAGYPEDHDFSTRRIEGPDAFQPVDEASISTNASAQYGLTAIQNLALIGDRL